MDVSYFIDIVNFEGQAIQLAIDALDQPAIDPSEAIDPFLEGSDTPIILESIENDDGVTKVIKGRRLTCGFNSTDPVPFVGGTTLANNVDTFSDGDEENYRVQLNISSGPGTIPFVGNLVLDDNTEAFQPTPNPVRLFASDGLGSLKDIRLRESDGDVPVGHFRLIDYIYLCLNNIRSGPNVYIAMNLYEKSRFRKLSANFNITATNKFRIPYEHLGFLTIGDTIEITGSLLGNNGSYTITDIIPNPTTSIDIEVSTSTFTLETIEVWIFISTNHTFWDIMLDATTFETDVNERDDCFTVLTKILDAFGCFITYDDTGTAGGWYIVRWDEYDLITTGSSTLKFAKFTYGVFPVFNEYVDIDLDKIIAHDSDFLYEGHRLSQDNAVKRFQRMAHSVSHTYRLEQPKEVPCNVGFTSVGDVNFPLSGVDYTAYDLVCWDFFRGIPQVSNDGSVYTKIIYELNYEKERYTVFTAQPSNDIYYIVSQTFPVTEGDKVDLSALIKWTGNIDTGLISAPVMGLRLTANDGTYYACDAGESLNPKGEWVLSDINNSYGAGFGYASPATKDDTDWQQVGFFDRISDMIPKDGKLQVIIMQAWDVTTLDFHVKDIKLTYYPNLGGSFDLVTGEQHKVTGNNNSRKNIEHEMFISDPSKPLLKGCLKKFDGTNYIVTETWNYYHDPTVLTDSKLSKHIVFQWWNQFRKIRTVIETDIQGLAANDTVGIPGMVYRWKIIHGDQEEKKFMLTSFRGMDFKTCGWNGVFVETSEVDGDKNYDDEFSFKYIQE